MTCRNRCKTLARKKTKLEGAIQVQLRMASIYGSQKEWEYLGTLTALKKKLGVLLELLQIDAWEARQACKAAGISLPPPKKSESKGFGGLTSDQLKELKQRLESQSDADSAVLAREQEN
mgnify:CR=1 FL=1